MNLGSRALTNHPHYFELSELEVVLENLPRVRQAHIL